MSPFDSARRDLLRLAPLGLAAALPPLAHAAARTPGRAMRVTDHARAQGAILGKAMTGLKAGHGLVLVLVTLQ